ncbi:hypothetical protein ACFLEY_03820 [Bradyrhizobium sp. YCK136]|uniref:hypothetical protein n=1 Tax=Bradyrhizobium sp. YCK136 TaxID=3351346 RepID=UPI0037CC8AC8
MTPRDDEDPAEEQIWDRESAVEFLEMEIYKRNTRRSDNPIILPLEAARLIFDCAKLGQHKGHGRKGAPPNRVKKLQSEAIVNWARKRRDKLRAEGMKATGANSAEDQAAEEASSFASERYGFNLAASTIKRKMQSRIDD